MRQRRKPLLIFIEMVEKYGRIPTLEEWLTDSGFKRTSYFESKKIYKLSNLYQEAK